MQVTRIDIKYKAFGEYYFYLASDLHFGNQSFYSDMYTKEFDEAKRLNARIFLNGDIFDLIGVKDMKRYRKSGDKYPGVDAIINKQIAEGAEILSPYAELLEMVGAGNHESAYVSYNSYDPISGLISILQYKTGRVIRHGGYEGFIVLHFEHVDGGGVSRYIIYYNHGQGGAAEVTGGAIDLNRRTYVRADLIWLGHKHAKTFRELPSEIGLDRNNNVYEKQKRGIITGSFIRNLHMSNPDETGYQSDYATERCRVPQANGGAILRITQHAGEIEGKLIL